LWTYSSPRKPLIISGIRVYTIETYGVVRSKATITYRFEKSNEIEKSRARTGLHLRPIHVPTAPDTIGDNIRLRRLKLKLLQKDVAEQIGVDKTSVHNWENSTKLPRIEHIPAIITFLGYNPLPPANNWVERLVRGRTSLGLSQRFLSATSRINNIISYDER
jgi:DNA-binding XRE family transcriptional regulator